MNFLALLSLALAPGFAIGLYIYLKDKHEREPIYLLLISFFYGSVSTLITLIISFPINKFLLTSKTDVIDQFYEAFFKVGLVEEFSKLIFVRFILYYNKNFNEPFDGIVYAVMVAMGFATIENIIFVFEQGFVTGLLRTFTAVPAHAAFAVIMGYFLGKAKFTARKELYYTLLALLTATLFHGAYDYFWFISFVPGIWIGAMASLLLAFILSRQAIKLHQNVSPFITKEIVEKLPPTKEKNDTSDID